MAISTPALNPSSAPTSSAASSSAPRAARPSDDEILGLVAAPASNALADSGSGTADAPSTSPSTDAASAEPENFRAIFKANPSLRDAWRDAQAYRELFPDVQAAREIQKLFPTAGDARAASVQLADLAKLDTLFFSNRPEAHAELAAAVYRLNPAAFRNLARMMQAVATDSADPGNAANRANANSNSADAPRASHPDATWQADQQAERAAAAQASFFHETNAAAVTGVIDAIHAQVDRLLPEGTTERARQRVVGEIYREIDSSLRSNPTFGQQLRQAFRAGNFSPENQRAIAGMVVARARQALPGIAKKVINEWTAGVVAQSSSRSQRQRSAERRVDIAGGSPGSSGRRALSPRDIDYRKLSDADILNL